MVVEQALSGRGATEMRGLNERGMSLIAVLVATAVVGILAVILMTMFGGVSSLVMRGNVNEEADNIARMVQDIMGQPDTCDYALRMNNPAMPLGVGQQAQMVQWNFNAGQQGPICRQWVTGAKNPALPCQDIPNIEIYPNGGRDTSGAFVLAPAMALGPVTGGAVTQISPNLAVTGMYIRELDPTLDNGISSYGTTAVRDWDYNNPQAYPGNGLRCNAGSSASCMPANFVTTTAMLVLRFANTSVTTGAEVFGGALAERNIPVNVAVDATNFNIAYCYQVKAVKSVDMKCDSANLYPGQPDCPQTSGPCQKLYYIDGFDALGKAVCKCQIACDQGQGAAASGSAASASASASASTKPKGKGNSGAKGTKKGSASVSGVSGASVGGPASAGGN